MIRGALCLAAAGLLAFAIDARADLAVTAGSGTTIFDFTCFTSKHCSAKVNIKSDGTEIFTSSNPGLVSGTGTAGTAATGVVTIQGIASMTKLLVTPDLPSGASTAAKQPALGTAGSASSDVITVQGIASGTALFVGSATAPVSTMNSASSSGGVTAPIAGVFDDTSPTAITENSFGFLRMSANRNLYSTLRDAAGNERGANVNSSNELLVAVSSLPSHAVTNAGTFAVQAAATQSGTWNITNVSGTVSLPTGASTAAKQPALGTAGTASSDVITVQGIASMTPLLQTVSQGGNSAAVTTAGADGVSNTLSGLATYARLQCYNGSTWDRCSTGNFTQIGGNTVDVNSGNKSTGSQRVVIATDDVAHGPWGQVATGAAPPASVQYMGANASGATGGLMRGMITCDLHAKYDASDNGSKTLVTGVSGRKIYVCGYILATGGTATNLKLREGSDADCASNGADLTPAYQLVANDKIGMQAPFWTGLTVSTNAYYACVNASAGNAHQAEIFYTIL